ncbi:endonuclease/exonuclease/phosphatase family protein [Ruania albidiflava]|uniref:endonuclease/exonuclease/phosphatase family protein n=1 Tax=Ruania albidiflava TaxID=366586 RepID=UPI0003B5B929|nr:endonuclease/exonuclease/phosphatase family protein [Ruania albidiflava]
MTRVLTLNLQHGVLGGTGTVATAEELTDALAPLRTDAPDVLALQEVDRGQRRSHGLDQAAVVADALDLPHVRFAAALGGQLGRTRSARRAAQRSGNHPGPAYGVAIASRYPVVAAFVRPLPGLHTLLPRPLLHRFRLTAADEPRVLLGTVLATPAGRLAVACTHLSTVPPIAFLQLRQVLAAVGSLGVPALVCGDLNLRALPVQALSRRWRRAEALTFPVVRPDRQIDHLLLDPGSAPGTLTAVSSLPLGVSDHRGLAAELRL